MPESVTPNNLSRVVVARARHLRKARGWTAQRLADELTATGFPISRSRLAVQESDERSRITVDQVAPLCEVFGISFADLIGPYCDVCGGSPPTGFTCNACGKSSK